MATTTAAVGLVDVTKRFPGVLAVDRVTLDFAAGEVHALLGENGAGKSTIVAMLSGLQQPDGGSLSLAGDKVRLGSPTESLRAGISTVFQHDMLVPTLSVFENLILGEPWWRHPDRAGVEARLADLSRDFGLDVPLDANAIGLSLGERQQIEIARALLRDSRVLILDEPTSMLTPQGVEELGARMRALAARGLAVIFITHKLGEAYRFGDRISVMKQGRLAGSIAPEVLRQKDEASAIDEMVHLMFGADDRAAAPKVRGATPDGPVRLAASRLCVNEASDAIAVSDVSFEVRAGEVFGVAGIDGNGQKQLAEVLAGQRQASSGTVMLHDRDVTNESVGRRRALGLRYLTDDRLAEGSVGSFPVADNTVLKEIGAAPFFTGGFERRQTIAEHARQLIARFQVRTPSETTPIGRLSGGNIQKVLLGRELSGDAGVVIFNKPTYGLDLQNIAASRERIAAIAAEGIAVLLISTDLDELIELCSRIAVLDRGQIAGIVDNDPAAHAAMRQTIGRLMVGERLVDEAA